MNPITVITASRRPELYRKMVEQVDSVASRFIEKFVVAYDDQDEQYKAIGDSNNRVQLLRLQYNFIYQYGFDSLYNLLLKTVKTKYAWMIFDTDELEMIDADKFATELETDTDMFGYDVHMQRGDVWETKYQLYQASAIEWRGLVHENQVGKRELKNVHMIDCIKVIHRNAVDQASQDLKKTPDGFIILEKTEDETDSDKRNMLYESLAWKVVHGGRHDYPKWFQRHYEINKELIDYYNEKAKGFYQKG